MILNMGERAILSYYHSQDTALQAVKELKEAGLQDVEIDAFPGSPVVSHHYDNHSSLESMFQNPFEAYINDQYTGVPHGQDLRGDSSYIVTVIVDQKKIDQALSIVKKYAYVVN
ncbi:MAG: hypothetical protein ACM3PP_12375 [Candidatus Saccharibacteria bacterium]